MKNTTEVPNDLIISAHKEACVKWKRIIENACPELFKPKFEYDKWVKIENAEGGCYCANGVVGITRSNIPAGVSHSGMMEQDNGVFIQSDGYWYRIGVKTKIKYLTPSEVESHLIKVAEEKGYLKGVKIKSDYSNKEGVITGAFFMNDGDLCVNVEGNKSILVFDNETGKWATIIPSPLEVKANKSTFKFGDIVKIIDGSNNKDKKTGEHRHGIDSLFKTHKAVVIETDLSIPTYIDFENYKQEDKLTPWMFSDLLLKFETGQEVYTSSKMCVKQ